MDNIGPIAPNVDGYQVPKCKRHGCHNAANVSGLCFACERADTAREFEQAERIEPAPTNEDTREMPLYRIRYED